MNDFDLHYLHYARSEELRKDAENERQARRLIKAAKATRRSGATARRHGEPNGAPGRVARALGLGHRAERATAENEPRTAS